MATLAKLLGWFSLAVLFTSLGLHVAGYVPGAPLAFTGPPVEGLPDTEDYPNLSYFTKAEVATARESLAKADLSKVKDEEVTAAIEQLRSWLDEYAKSGRDLVCTYA